jgi:precorrin-6B methylase 2
MKASPCVRRSCLTIFLSLVATSIFAQTPPAATGQFKPQVGQEGKDVIWVPTPDALVTVMLDMAKVGPQDVVMDLGSGDGRTVIAAAKRGARAIGVEYDPKMVELSRRNATSAGVSDKATFVNADLFQTDLSQATVITMFLLDAINLKLRPTVLNLKPGTRIVSNFFDMGDWIADASQTRSGCTSWCTALLWIVPAKVEGTWRSEQGELAIEQTFQMISGTFSSAGASVPVAGRLRGDEINFTAGKTQYQGRVEGNTISGTARSSEGSSPWTATRADR